MRDWYVVTHSKSSPRRTRSLSLPQFLGGPGAGKGTQCTRLANDLDLVHVSVGDLLRALAEEPLAEKNAHIHAAMSNGSLVSPAYVQNILGGYLDQLVLKGRTRFLIDGFPRSEQQAQIFQDQASYSLRDFRMKKANQGILGIQD